MEKYIPPKRTKVPIEDVAPVLARAWWALFGEHPEKGQICLLLAQWALETGRGRSMKNYNLGNAKSKSGDGRDYTYFACNEILSEKYARGLTSRAGQRVNGKGPNAVITKVSAGKATVWLYPNHNGCRFRAFETLAEGAADYLDMLFRRFSRCWVHVRQCNPTEFVNALKRQGYFTADVTKYRRAIVSLYKEFMRKDLQTGPQVPESTNEELQIALARAKALSVKSLQELAVNVVEECHGIFVPRGEDQ